jgi:serine/threonine protein kinase
MSQIAQGLRFLHINKIVHLDMKPENVLFLKGFVIKIIDFGEAYHPDAPYHDSRPAYTYPYGCP